MILSRQSAALKEAIDDLEWPGSSIQIKLQPAPPSVIFRGEGHGDLQIDFNCYANTDLLIAFSCDRPISHRFCCHLFRLPRLPFHTHGFPTRADCFFNGLDRGGMLKVQHLVSVAKPSTPHPHIDSAGYQQPSRIAYIEFFVKPEVEEDIVNDY
ncbi:UNVERIFIED_CONTAM: hypothetical protein Slati_4504500 [Sesamum latifolium]|uniref:Uncharacterized protein n=1 Tax=Sesamum latifolium TaxID=2727402 RepID=A0AAW2SSM4_9LAMI